LAYTLVSSIVVTKKSTSPNAAHGVRSAGFVLFRQDGDRRIFLLLRHNNGGHWSFPKGRIEREESEFAAALRETREETGIRVGVPVSGFRSVSRYRFSRDGRPVEKSVVYFLAEVSEHEVRLSGEHDAATWLPAEGARRTLTYEESRNVLDAAERWLESLRRSTAPA
jgi:bis(5'-nucleosidyl)-tetraphosphatase